VAVADHSASKAATVAQLEESRRSLMDAISRFDEEGFRARRAGGEWNAAEVLTHLLIAEQRNLDRAETALAQDNPSFPWLSDEQVAEETRVAQRMPVPQIVHGLLALRRNVLQRFESLTDEQLARRYRHERRGELTVGWLFGRMAEHEAEHAEQIRTMREAATPA
jgi:hypothetical protein